jgi:anti-sigma regulatory factor (Ser/Thr protein kinase)
LAVHEAIVNADRHGGGATRVDASIDGDALEVAVCDRGSGFEIPRADLEPSGAADPFAEDGRGVWLICRIASRTETRWDGGQFCLRMRFEPPGARPRR